MKKLLCFACISMSAWGFALNQTPNHEASLNQIMPPSDQKKTGVHKLNKDERENLKLWLQNYALANKDPSQGDLDFKPFISTLSINGLGGQYIILANNTVWEIAPDDQGVASAWLSPISIRVTVDPGNPYPYKLTNLLSSQSINAKKSSMKAIPQMQGTFPAVPKQDSQLDHIPKKTTPKPLEEPSDKSKEKGSVPDM